MINNKSQGSVAIHLRCGDYVLLKTDVMITGPTSVFTVYEYTQKHIYTVVLNSIILFHSSV